MASDELHRLDLRQGEAQAVWQILPISGPTPGRRYGHVMVYSMPHLTVYGGNTGVDTVNDVWTLSTERQPLAWARISFERDSPPPRMYHVASLCLSGTAAGMIVCFGGRSKDLAALNDTWGLCRHRGGTWDWIRAPYKPGGVVPTARYQHTGFFVGSALVVVGGRVDQVGGVPLVEVYETKTSEWTTFAPVPRFRHTCWWMDGMIYVHGGLNPANNGPPTDVTIACNAAVLLTRAPKPELKAVVSSEDLSGPAAVPPPTSIPIPIPIPIPAPLPAPVSPLPSAAAPTPISMKREPNKPAPSGIAPTSSPKKQAGIIQHNGKRLSQPAEEEKQFRLSNEVDVAVSSNPDKPNNEVRRLQIGSLREEPKKLVADAKLMMAEPAKDPREPLYTTFINYLLRPKEFSQELPESMFMIRKEQVLALAQECQAVLQTQPILAHVRAPVKIFGDIHGDYQDLMRFFAQWRGPTSNSTGGDIDSVAYLFLGNFVDGGTRSLETICLLLALKLKYPKQIVLLRGSHEDPAINRLYGLAEECKTRLHEDVQDPASAFQALNRTFAWLPLAAIVEGRILCIHGGIGPHFRSLPDVANLRRPLTSTSISACKTAEGDTSSETEAQSESSLEMGVAAEAQREVLADVLWSEPAESERQCGFTTGPAVRETSVPLVRYGNDVLKQFLAENELELIVRGHTIAQEGLAMFADSTVLTITSCSNYCGRLGNTACMLLVLKTLEIVPKYLSPPLERTKDKLWIDHEQSSQGRTSSPSRK
jgi:protein phosphatase